MLQIILCCIQGRYNGLVLVWLSDMQFISTVCSRLPVVLASKVITTINIYNLALSLNITLQQHSSTSTINIDIQDGQHLKLDP
jgi:hypothetical protein